MRIKQGPSRFREVLDAARQTTKTRVNAKGPKKEVSNEVWDTVGKQVWDRLPDQVPPLVREQVAGMQIEQAPRHLTWDEVIAQLKEIA